MEVIRAELPQTCLDEIHEFTGQDVTGMRMYRLQISVIKIMLYLEASFQFWGRLRDGHGGQGDNLRRLQHGPQEFQLDIIHHGF
jgi:hypothetical protein